MEHPRPRPALVGAPAGGLGSAGGSPSAHRRLRTALALLLTLVQLLVVAVAMPAAHADDPDDKQRRKQAIDQRIAVLREDMVDVDQDLSATYLALARTEMEIPDAQKDLDAARRELDIARREDEQTGRRLQSAQQEESRLTGQSRRADAQVHRSDEQLKQVSIDAYKAGGVPDPVSVYTGGADPQQAVDRSMNYRLALEVQGARLQDLRTDATTTHGAVDRLGAVRQEISDLKQKSAQSLQRRETAEKQAADTKASLDALYARQSQQKRDLEAKKEKYKAQEGQLEDQSTALDADIAALARTEKARVAQDPAPAPAPPSGSGYMLPVEGRRSSPFGWRIHPVYHTRKLHKGQDFAVACGTPVRATQAGRVLETTHTTAGGNKVVLSHGISNGHLITSSYHHLQGFAVSAGQTIPRGQVVGYVGSTGASTGCHLHWQIEEDGTAVNPLGYV